MGYVVDLDFFAAWKLFVVDAHEALTAREALTAAELLDLLVDPLYRVGPDLGVGLMEGDPGWLVEIDTTGGHLRLVVAEVSLPDS